MIWREQPCYRAIVAVDAVNSTARTDMEKAELRRRLYEIFEDALYGAGIGESSRDALIDRGDGILTLIDPAVPKTVLLNEVVPTLGERLAEVAGLRLRTVVHAGEVLYDRRGVFDESVDHLPVAEGTLTLTVVGASPTLPSLLGRPVTEACAEMTNLGYRCDARPDVLHRNANVVAAQEPAPGTPLDPGDTVVVHYAPFDPLPVKLFRAKNDDPVWVMRIGDLEPGLRDTYDHANPQVLGYAYPIDRAQPGASRVVNGSSVSGRVPRYVAGSSGTISVRSRRT